MGATAGIVLSGANTASQVVAQRQQANAITASSNFDTQVANVNAADAVARGTTDAQLRDLRGRQAIGAQRAGLAASGIDANVGTPAGLQEDEAKFSELDQQMIRNNAAREAYGFTANAGFNALGAQQQASAVRQQSVNTLLTGAADAYGRYRGSRDEKLGTQSPAGTGIRAGKR